MVLSLKMVHLASLIPVLSYHVCNFASEHTTLYVSVFLWLKAAVRFRIQARTFFDGSPLIVRPPSLPQSAQLNNSVDFRL